MMFTKKNPLEADDDEGTHGEDRRTQAPLPSFLTPLRTAVPPGEWEDAENSSARQWPGNASSGLAWNGLRATTDFHPDHQRPSSPFNRFKGNNIFSSIGKLIRRDKAKDADRAKRAAGIFDEWGHINIDRVGFPKRQLYFHDLFHTLVNLRNWSFAIIFFVLYFLQFVLFAVPYHWQRNECVPGIRNFWHAVWFSVQTAMTIGYGDPLAPNPDCMLTNTLVMVQTITSLMVDYSMLGIFYARFSRPMKRAQTLVYSSHVLSHKAPNSNYKCLHVRVANLRKHQIIKADIRMLCAMHDDIDGVRMFDLKLVGGSRLFLGFPCSIIHLLTPDSPLYRFTHEDLERHDVEILVMLEGDDASTSSSVQACKSYLPTDVIFNHCFRNIVSRGPDGRRTVDFSKFDEVVPSPDMENE
eukprot:jgi/Mesvir1/17241/Mv07653-RA.1